MLTSRIIITGSLGTQNPELWPSPESASPVSQHTMYMLIVSSQVSNSRYYSFDRSSLYQLDYLMLPKRKCWWIKSGCWLSLKKEHICIFLTFCCWLKALERVTGDPGFSTPTPASLTHFFSQRKTHLSDGWNCVVGASSSSGLLNHPFTHSIIRSSYRHTVSSRSQPWRSRCRRIIGDEGSGQSRSMVPV